MKVVDDFFLSPRFWGTMLVAMATAFAFVAGAPDASVELSALFGVLIVFASIQLAHAHGIGQTRENIPALQGAAQLTLGGFVIAFVAIAIASVIGWQPMAYFVRAIGLMCAALCTGVFISVLMTPLFGPGTKGNAHDG